MSISIVSLCSKESEAVTTVRDELNAVAIYGGGDFRVFPKIFLKIWTALFHSVPVDGYSLGKVPKMIKTVKQAQVDMWQANISNSCILSWLN